MNSAERRDRIVEYLRIKPISHGQIHTFQIAVPESEVVEVPYEKREYLSNSLTQQGTNLIPIIVRRTEAYSEEEEYEVVYGADWCLIAKELDIEKLWVWVFDMTDEQAVAIKEEMQQLLGVSDSIPIVLPPGDEQTESTQTIVEQLDKFFRELAATLNQKIDKVAVSVKKIETHNSHETDTYNKIEILTQKVEILAKKFEQPATDVNKTEKTESKQSNPLSLLNSLDKDELSIKLKRARIPDPEKTAKAIEDARNNKPKREFEDYRDVVKSVKGLAEKRILIIIDEWSRSQ